ncbi:S-adenosyl-L-methionine-dependent methyltransferase [Zychaea mexicana]|uniref:S-adenosyl-L-methionine-dependent methyltransferase n=1 Tax=Zychaea mexicana TaxID=64656 RepID=UPI0022FEC878|nr:S-adenosyl-L-methionine-dependent methyltransferase [Zychaea mexicana]KAI9497853.1 S-adenosyl-L-methionine-dependent methyltransferase [Zychaea mexicana]
MGNRISRRSRTSQSESGTGGDSVDYRVGAVSTTYSAPNFPELPIPANELEITRQRHEHFLLKHIFQKSYFAPVDSILQDSNAVILDYGCGLCGTWLVEMANDYPNARFHGIDMFKLPEPEDGLHIPPNLHFDKANILQGILRPNDSFDYIHQRAMLHAYHGDDIAYVMRELMRLLKPGGWLELVEYDLVPKRAGPLFARLFDVVYNYLKSRQKHIFHGPKLRRFLTDGGFQDIHFEYSSIPICWGGYLGKLMYENCLTGLRHLGPVIYHELFNTDAGFNEAHFEEYIDKAFDECVQYQTFMNIHWAYGRKPTNA